MGKKPPRLGSGGSNKFKYLDQNSANSYYNNTFYLYTLFKILNRGSTGVLQCSTSYHNISFSNLDCILEIVACAAFGMCRTLFLISNANIFLSIADVRVHVSDPYTSEDTYDLMKIIV